MSERDLIPGVVAAAVVLLLALSAAAVASPKSSLSAATSSSGTFVRWRSSADRTLARPARHWPPQAARPVNAKATVGLEQAPARDEEEAYDSGAGTHALHRHRPQDDGVGRARARRGRLSHCANTSGDGIGAGDALHLKGHWPDFAACNWVGQLRDRPAGPLYTSASIPSAASVPAGTRLARRLLLARIRGRQPPADPALGGGHRRPELNRDRRCERMEPRVERRVGDRQREDVERGDSRRAPHKCECREGRSATIARNAASCGAIPRSDTVA
jgi:hypothetical protein